MTTIIFVRPSTGSRYDFVEVKSNTHQPDSSLEGAGNPRLDNTCELLSQNNHERGRSSTAKQLPRPFLVRVECSTSLIRCPAAEPGSRETLTQIITSTFLLNTSAEEALPMVNGGRYRSVFFAMTLIEPTKLAYGNPTVDCVLCHRG